MILAGSGARGAGADAPGGGLGAILGGVVDSIAEGRAASRVALSGLARRGTLLPGIVARCSSSTVRFGDVSTTTTVAEVVVEGVIGRDSGGKAGAVASRSTPLRWASMTTFARRNDQSSKTPMIAPTPSAAATKDFEITRFGANGCPVGRFDPDRSRLGLPSFAAKEDTR